MSEGEAYRARPHLTSWGELLWDVYPAERRLGGAPANFAFHAAALGARANLVTRVGADSLGIEAVDAMRNAGVEVLAASPSSAPTGSVLVELCRGEPSYTIVAPAAYDDIEATEEAVTATIEADIVYFGTLALRAEPSRAALELALRRRREASAPGWIAVDLNLRAPFDSIASIEGALNQADVLKLSQAELESVARRLDVAEPMAALFHTFGVGVVVVTHGAQGARLFTPSISLVQPAFAAESAHPVGAGDAFFAAFSVNFSANQRLEECLERAARYAAFVVEHEGSMPKLHPDQLRRCQPDWGADATKAPGSIL